MFSILSRSCIGIIAVVISGCTTLQIPAWVEGKSTYYTTGNYLLGHGVGQNVSVAMDNASRKITQQFKLISDSKELSSQTSMLFNLIQYEESWLNTDTDKHHVLAYISRSDAASFIRNKMLSLDELTYQFFEQAKATTDLLEQTSYIDSAINAQTRRLNFKPVLKIISSESDITSSYNIARLTKIRDQLQGRINLQVDIVQDKLGELDNIIKDSLDAAGFIRNDKIPSQNHLLVELKIDTTAIPQSSNGLLMQGELTASLRHKGDESIRGQHKWNFSVTADDQKTLIKKSREILTTQLNSNIKRVIMDMMVIEYEINESIPSQDYVDFEMPEFNVPDKTADEKSTTTKTTTDTAPEQTKTEAAVVAPVVIDNKEPKTENNQAENKQKEKQAETTQDIYAEPETAKTTETTNQENNSVSDNIDSNTTSTPTEAATTTEATVPANNPDASIAIDAEDPISTLPALAN